MALQGEWALLCGITLSEAYLKIERVVDNRSARGEPHITIEASLYVSAEKRQEKKDPISQFSFTCCLQQVDPESGVLVDDPVYAQYFSLEALNIAGVNMVSNSYLYLKSLPAFATLADC